MAATMYPLLIPKIAYGPIVSWHALHPTQHFNIQMFFPPILLFGGMKELIYDIEQKKLRTSV